jgi:glutaredoxin 3
MPEITVYTTPTCPYCFMALRLLKAKELPFRQVNVAGDGAKRGWLAEVTGQSTVPQVFIGERSIGGYTELAALERSGQLDAMLAPV